MSSATAERRPTHLLTAKSCLSPQGSHSDKASAGKTSVLRCPSGAPEGRCCAKWSKVGRHCLTLIATACEVAWYPC